VYAERWIVAVEPSEFFEDGWSGLPTLRLYAADKRFAVAQKKYSDCYASRDRSMIDIRSASSNEGSECNRARSTIPVPQTMQIVLKANDHIAIRRPLIRRPR
jgi:hypothetical protein